MIIYFSIVQPILDLLDNAVLAWGLAACGLAQFLKVVFELVLNKKWRPEILFETGGMPSSHSALVTGTSAGIGIQMGFGDPLFALAVTISFVVMYDASGIRRASGIISERINLLPSKLWEAPLESPLKESLGHTRLEVLIGSLIGPTIALPGIVFIGSPIELFKMFGITLS
tara:strand:- start:237 stop:749 length:513 start_codon:yes stop_codon:yes gene_type:complete